tara:strand:- start:540 stop:749 length:210 start_codon:yes stop_codon:yes gene_type:complete
MGELTTILDSNIDKTMEKFNGVREISKGVYKAMIFIEGKHIDLMDGSEKACEKAYDKALIQKFNANKTR